MPSISTNPGRNWQYPLEDSRFEHASAGGESPVSDIPTIIDSFYPSSVGRQHDLDFHSPFGRSSPLGPMPSDLSYLQSGHYDSFHTNHTESQRSLDDSPHSRSVGEQNESEVFAKSSVE